MTSFVDDSGNYLEYNGNDIPITKQAASIYDFKIKGDVSLNFKIPNNSHNRNTLGYNGPMDVGRVAFSKIAFNILRNGNFFLRGYLVIQGDDGKDLDCFFLSGNANWFNKLQDNLAELDYNDMAVTSDPYLTIGSTSGILFPVVDYAHKGRKTNNYFNSLVYEGDSFESDVGYFAELLPCVYLHSVVQRMAREAQIQITGDVLNSSIYNQIIITPYTADLRWPNKLVNESEVDISRSGSQAILGGLVYYQIEFDVLDRGEAARYNTSTWAYTAFKTGLYRIELDLTMNTSQDYTIRPYVNGSFSTTTSQTEVLKLTGGKTVGVAKLVKGDILTLWIAAASGFQLNPAKATIKLNPIAYGRLHFSAGSGTYVQVNHILKDMKGIDLIKSIITLFGAQATFDDTTQTLTLNRIDGIDTYEDWSSYYLSHDINYNTKVAKSNYIDYAKVGDEFISTYNDTNNKKFASGNIEVDTDLQEESTLTTLSFGPARDIPNPLMWQAPYIPLIKLEIDKTYDITSVSSSGGFAQFNRTAGDTIYNGQLFYFVANASNLVEYDGYHMSTNSSTSANTSRQAFGSTTVGKLSTLKFSFVDSVNRLLLCQPGVTVTDLSSLNSDIDFYNTIDGIQSSATADITWFYKKPVGVNFDAVKTSLAFDDLAGVVYSNLTLGKLNFSRIKQMIKNPIIQTKFLLPESVFQIFNFDRIIKLNTKDLQGDFYVLKVGNYMNARESVMVDLIRI